MIKKITREEYLKALETIDLYNRKTRLSLDWLCWDANITVRLRNAIMSYRRCYPEIRFVDEINMRRLRKTKNFGYKSYKELTSIIESKNFD